MRVKQDWVKEDKTHKTEKYGRKAGTSQKGVIVEMWILEWLIRGLLWLTILIVCTWIVRRRLRKWKQGEYCDCCDGSCGGCRRKTEK